MKAADWPEWAKTLDRGDIVRTPTGTERVVREVHRHSESRVYVSFTILHCSWTTRPVTVYSMGELVRVGYTYAGRRIEIKNTRLNKSIDREVKCRPGPPKLTCCDIKGVR